MMDEPGSFFRTILSAPTLRAMKAAAVATRKTVSRSAAGTFFADTLLPMIDTVARPPGQMKSRRLKTRTARPRMKAV